MAAEAKFRTIKYWLKIVTGDRNRLLYRAYEAERNLVVRGNSSCWAGRVKHELDELGYSFMWHSQEWSTEEEVKRLLPLIKQTIRDSAYVLQLNAAASLESTAHLGCRKPESLPLFRELKTQQYRRNFSRLSLSCPGGMLHRSELVDRCAACRMIILGNVNQQIFVHRIYRCEKFKVRRQKYEKSSWFKRGKALPNDYFLRYIRNSKHCIKTLGFFY